MVRTDGHTLSEKRNYQVTNSMFGASRKKFVEGVDSDYHDENMYYSRVDTSPSWIRGTRKFMRTVRKGHDSMVRTDGHTLSE
ncbi:hypothetical protein NPN19_24845, partial [Vibrio parahaemolyticus]|uniref:hypothetical protein n=1 Tax=Vibrio parahaemolyticus TaxID=670 RepID=UPI00211339C5